MIVPDVNLLIYAYDTNSRYHTAAKKWWEAALAGNRRVGLTWSTMLGFIRIATNPRVYVNPLTAKEATRTVRYWLNQPSVDILLPGEGHAELVLGLIDNVGVAGNLTSDAHLAAIAIEFQAELASNDQDFARFPGLRWFNPLRGQGRI